MSLEQSFVTVDKATHDLKSFGCGKPSMDEFLTRYAVKHTKLGLSRTYVLPEVSSNSKVPIAAYYTLAFSTVLRSDIPATQSLPSYPIPVVMLARLAIDERQQGTGLGSKVLVYALRHAARLSNSGLPAYALVLDVLDEQALSFYQRFEMFKPFTNDPIRLFVPMKIIEQI